MSVGTAHLAATVNTLVFAYLGSALPIIVLLALQIHRLDLAINDEHIAVEVVRTVVGAIGILSAVPLTTAIAAWSAGPAGRAGTVPRRIMAVPLPVDATPVAVAAAVAAKPPRGRVLRRLLPRRRPKETAPVEDLVEMPASIDAPVAGQLTLPTDAGPDAKPIVASAAALAPQAEASEAPVASESTPPAEPAPAPALTAPTRKLPAPRSGVGIAPTVPLPEDATLDPRD
jgi:hypothetical protein